LKNKKRFTISLDEKLIWMLRNKQTEMMLDTNKQVSISAVVNTLIEKMMIDETVRNSNLDSIFTFQSNQL